MSSVIVLVLVCCGIAYVMVPLFRRVEEKGSTSALQSARERKARALESILDLEADHEIGKLTADEFAILRSEQEQDAVQAMRELDVLEAAAGDELEREIAQIRERLTCKECGAALSEEGRCPSCTV